MTRFNESKTVEKEYETTNRAGGPAHEQSPKLALASQLVTSMMKDQYYRDAQTSLEDLAQHLQRVPVRFAAKGAITARRDYSLRSVSHALAGYLAPLISGESWGKRFYYKVVQRPDDMTEILAFFQSKVVPHLDRNPSITSAMKKGFAARLEEYDEYLLDKYAQRRKRISLHDVINLVHPEPTEAIDALMNGTIDQAQTWEKERTDAGESTERDKSKVWKDLLEKDKLGYFATLRNLRNMAQESDKDTLHMAIQVLTDPKRFHRSKVLPFNIAKAYRAIGNAVDIERDKRQLLYEGLNEAADGALANIPEFEGDTLVMLDTSGSMRGDPIKHGALFAATLYKGVDADLLTYSRTGEWHTPSLNTPLLEISKRLEDRVGGGTDCPAAFREAIKQGKEYDRIVVLTDMQSWAGHARRGDDVQRAFSDYRSKTGCNPMLYNFDLQGYGDMQFPERKVACIAGFSPKVFDVMQLYEQDRQSLVSDIESTIL